jgi:ubiquinone/menaquinone biosynthesis C-methylase UbiE
VTCAIEKPGARVAPEWDYSAHAEWYRFRPNYARTAIATLVARIEACRRGFRTADVGAGTGNLTVMLLAENVRPIVAVEPNEVMRAQGQAATRGAAVTWRIGSGEATGLADASVDWFAMGSSFNTTDRARCLEEAARVLRPGGWFTCLWNHRDLDDPIQRRVEELIRRRVPDYAAGTRREDQAPVIAASERFDVPELVEVRHAVARSVDDYLAAWRSVKNGYWDLGTPSGRALLDAICEDIRTAVGSTTRLDIVYTTRAWSARVRR